MPEGALFPWVVVGVIPFPLLSRCFTFSGSHWDSRDQPDDEKWTDIHKKGLAKSARIGMAIGKRENRLDINEASCHSQNLLV